MPATMANDFVSQKRGTTGRLVSQQEEALRKTPRNALGVSPWTTQVALAIVSLRDIDAGANWLQRRNRLGVPLPEHITRKQIIEYLENIVLAASPDTIANWSDGHMCPNKRALAEATRFVRKQDLRDLVYHQNIENGKPVTSQDVLSIYNSFNDESNVSGSILPMVPHYLAVESSRRTWVYRWRKSFNCKIGAIKPGDVITLLEKRIKEIIFDGRKL